MISITAAGLRNLATLIEALDKTHADTGLEFSGGVTMPAERYSVMAHDVELRIAFVDAGKVHALEVEG